MIRFLLSLTVAAAGVLLNVDLANATHIRAADITAKRISATSFTYEFTITAYRDSGSPVEFGDGSITFGDGNESQLDLIATSFTRVEVNDAFIPYEIITSVFEHTFSSPGTYIVGYAEPNRNDDIVNMNNSVSTHFYLDILIFADPSFGLNASPVFQTIPLDKAFTGVTFTHNPWAIDPDGDSLAFKLVTVKQAANTEVQNYRAPNNPEFYQSPIDYNTANEAGNGPASFAMDPITGVLTWDAPGNFTATNSLPEYNIAFMVEEWRKVSGSWRRIGYVSRDMQILVINDFMGSRPNGSIPTDAPIEEGKMISEAFQFSDPDGDPVLVETYSTLYDLQTSPAISSNIPSEYQTGPVSVTFDWTPAADQIDGQPHLVHFKVSDKPQDQFEVPKVTYLTWVIGESRGPEVITGLDDPLEIEQISLYPNPAYDRIKLKMGSGSEEQVSLSMTNYLGQTLYRTSTYGDSIELDLSAYKPGVYLLHATSKNIRWSKRFIKL